MQIKRRTAAAGITGAALLAAGAVALAAPSAQGAPVAAGETAAAANSGPTVTVDGEGEAIGTPDTLALSLAVDVVRPDVSSALTTAGVDSTRVTAVLTKDGVAAADVQTSGLSVTSRTERHGKVVGYEVTEALAVTLRRFSSAGQTLGDAVAAGGNDIRVQGLTPALSDPVALGVTARQRAFADAKARAQQYADLAHRTLGAPLSIDASSNNPNDQTPAKSGTLAFTDSGSSTTASAASVPVSAGSQPVDVSITVVWSLH